MNMQQDNCLRDQTTPEERGWSEFCQKLADYLARFGHTISDLDFAKAVLLMIRGRS